MNREQLRAMILAGDDQIINTPILWNRLTAQQQLLTLAARAFWANTASSVTTAALDSLLTLYEDAQQPAPGESDR
jgi:hypothetical protein